MEIRSGQVDVGDGGGGGVDRLAWHGAEVQAGLCIVWCRIKVQQGMEHR